MWPRVGELRALAEVSVEHWREVHTRFWAAAGSEVSDESIVTCVYFRLASPTFATGESHVQHARVPHSRHASWRFATAGLVREPPTRMSGEGDSRC
jgi:hypothetical protein